MVSCFLQIACGASRRDVILARFRHLSFTTATPDIASRNSNVLSINRHKRFIVAESPEREAIHDRDEFESRTYSRR
jgi:hypothetical protein